jgi:hypothetical protein
MTWKVRFPIGLLAGWLAVGLACDSDDCDDPAQVCDAELDRCVAIWASQPTSEWSFE